MDRSHFEKLAGGLNVRLVLAVVAIHLILVPALFGGLLFMVKQGYGEQFVNDTRSDAFLISNLAGRDVRFQAINHLMEEATLNGKILFAQFLAENGKTVFEFSDLKKTTPYREDFFFGEHSDDVYFISLPVVHQDHLYSMRLGFDETLTRLKIKTAYDRGIYLALAYVLLTFALLGFIIPKLNKMRREIVRQASVLQYQSLHDGLTGLPNRNLFESRIQQAAQRKGLPHFALLLMDLNRFKQVNDTLGHCSGDAVLVETGIRLRQVVRISDTVVRLGGDEFAIFLPGSDLNGAVAVAKKLIDAMDQPFNLDYHSLHIGASVGIAMSPDHGTDVNTLMRHVDVAMYEAKRTNSGYLVYDDSMDKDALTKLALSSELREGLGRGELSMVYQPQMDLADNEIIGVEALVRWYHPKHGLLLPDAFIKLAEDSGQIGAFTHWMLRETVRQISIWQLNHLRIKVSVNLSPINLHDPHLPVKIDKLLAEYQVGSEFLELEITESAIFSDIEKATETLKHIHNMGISLSIDDFGTGYSSLIHLKQLPISQIKIDRSFIMELNHDVNNVSIVNTLVELAHLLGLKVVAEGAEDMETVEILRRLNCDTVQGFYIAKPMPATEIERYLVNMSNQSQPTLPLFAKTGNQPQQKPVS